LHKIYSELVLINIMFCQNDILRINDSYIECCFQILIATSQSNFCYVYWYSSQQKRWKMQMIFKFTVFFWIYDNLYWRISAAEYNVCSLGLPYVWLLEKTPTSFCRYQYHFLRWESAFLSIQYSFSISVVWDVISNSIRIVISQP